jgi:hypothetical protein
MMHIVPKYSFLIVSLLIGSETLGSLIVFLVPLTTDRADIAELYALWHTGYPMPDGLQVSERMDREVYSDTTRCTP